MWISAPNCTGADCVTTFNRQRRRNPPDDSNTAGWSAVREAEALADRLSAVSTVSASPRLFSCQAASVLRRMDDPLIWHPMGGRARHHRRRRPIFPELANAGLARSHRTRRGRAQGPGGRVRVVVREEGEQGPDSIAGGLGSRGRDPRRSDPRDQIHLHSATRPGEPHGGRAADARDLHERNRFSVTTGITPAAAARSNSISTARRPSSPRSTEY